VDSRGEREKMQEIPSYEGMLRVRGDAERREGNINALIFPLDIPAECLIKTL
jgi:hypothetical protein